MLARFAEHWSPKKIAQINDYDVRIVKLQGDFTWHKHDDTDEMFLVLSGELTIQMRDRDVVSSGHGISLWCHGAPNTVRAPTSRPQCSCWSPAASSIQATPAASSPPRSRRYPNDQSPAGFRPAAIADTRGCLLFPHGRDRRTGPALDRGAAYQHYVPRIGREPAPMAADYTAPAPHGQAWLAAEDGHAVGFIILIPQPGYLLLENVAVLPAAQGHGGGARLLALADERARSLHLPEVRLYQRGDDREPGLLPTARIHRDPPGPAGRLPPGLLPQATGRLTPQSRHRPDVSAHRGDGCLCKRVGPIIGRSGDRRTADTRRPTFRRRIPADSPGILGSPGRRQCRAE